LFNYVYCFDDDLEDNSVILNPSHTNVLENAASIRCGRRAYEQIFYV